MGMAFTSSAAGESNTELQSKRAPAVAEPVVRFLRLEGLALAAISAVLYARTGSSWWLFAGLWLVPDLSMLGYLVSPCWGARCYNAIHTTITPITLAMAALLFHTAGPLPYALIWLNHIGVDRLLGYGLKYPAGFGWTHLGRQGKKHGEVTLAPSSPA
jgi:hypothetical protein